MNLFPANLSDGRLRDCDDFKKYIANPKNDGRKIIEIHQFDNIRTMKQNRAERFLLKILAAHEGTTIAHLHALLKIQVFGFNEKDFMEFADENGEIRQYYFPEDSRNKSIKEFMKLIDAIYERGINVGCSLPILDAWKAEKINANDRIKKIRSY